MAVKKRRRPQPASGSPLTAAKHIFLCAYGDSGIGKTRFVGTTPGRVLLIRSPVDHIDSILTAGMGDNITERIVRTWEEMYELRDELRHTGSKWDWVWVDSMSLVQDVMMDDVWAATVKRKKERLEFGLDKQEHGLNQFRLSGWMRQTVSVDLFNFGWTAHADSLPSPDLDEEGDPVEKLMPYIHGGKGAMSVKFCGYSTIVAYMRKDRKEKKRYLHTESNPVYYAKNQYSSKGLDWGLVNPSMPGLLERIEDGRSKRSSRRPVRQRSHSARRRRTTTTKRGSK